VNTLVKKHKVLTTEKTKILLSEIVYYSLALILLFTGITKIIDPLPLISTLKLLPIINEQAAIFTATLLPVIEIGLAILMLLGTYKHAAISHVIQVQGVTCVGTHYINFSKYFFLCWFFDKTTQRISIIHF
jgi:hypothetical protein